MYIVSSLVKRTPNSSLSERIFRHSLWVNSRSDGFNLPRFHAVSGVTTSLASLSHTATGESNRKYLKATPTPMANNTGDNAILPFFSPSERTDRGIPRGVQERLFHGRRRNLRAKLFGMWNRLKLSADLSNRDCKPRRRILWHCTRSLWCRWCGITLDLK